MKIDQLPVEMLMQIFNFLPTYGEVSLVNRVFYDIACAVNDSNICLRIDNRMDSECLRSIRKSKRQITKMEIGSYHFPAEDQRPYISLIKHFSSTIKHLTYRDALDESTCLEILSLTPNIEHLDLPQTCITPDSSKRRRYNDDLDLSLTKLKSLSIVGCSATFLTFFKHLPVGGLTELQVTDSNWHTFTFALNRQLNIKKLNFGCVLKEESDFFQFDDLSTDIFGKLKLESIELTGSTLNRVVVASILSKQPKLKSLILSDARFVSQTPVNDRVMDAVAELSELETLEMDVTDTPDESFVKIRRLKKLKDLTLRCGITDCKAKLKTLAESDNTSIVKLTIRGHCRRSVNLIGQLAKSAPNLKILRILPNGYVEKEELNEILARFNFVEILEIETYNRPSIVCSDYSNPKLEEITFFTYAPFYREWLPKLVAAYPNLKKLKLIFKSSSLFTQPFNLSVQPILHGFPKLESLTLHAYQLIVDDWDNLQNHRNNLKFVSLGRLNKVSSTDLLKTKLRTTFDVMKVSDSECLKMAIDRYTMNSENDEHTYR